MALNRCILIGRLTDEPDVRYTSGNEPLAIARYTLAVDRMKKDETDFIRCVAFGKQGEFVEKYVRKGMKMAVEGRIQTGSYEKDGHKVYTTDVVVERHDFCEKKSDSVPEVKEEVRESAEGFMDIPENIDFPFKK